MNRRGFVGRIVAGLSAIPLLSRFGTNATEPVTAHAGEIGKPAEYYKNGEQYLAIPFYDYSMGCARVATCKASEADNPGSWQITEAGNPQPQAQCSYVVGQWMA